jgi:hypothetical protein
MNDKSSRFFANAWGAHVAARNIGRPRESGKSTGANRELGAYSFLRTTEASICRSGTDQYFRSSTNIFAAAMPFRHRRSDKSHGAPQPAAW